MARKTYNGILGFFMIMVQLSIGWYFFNNAMTIYKFTNTGDLPSEKYQKRIKISQISMFIFFALCTAAFITLNYLLNDDENQTTFQVISMVF